MDEHANWRRDSDMVFTAISTSGAENYEQAQDMVVLFYVPSMDVSRAGISHALKRLEKFYADK